MTDIMPPRNGLPMHPQSLSALPEQDALHMADAPRGASLWRWAVFLPALTGTGALLGGLFSWLNMGGMTWLEWVLLALIGLSFVWVALAVSTVLIGLAGLARRRARPAPPTSRCLFCRTREMTRSPSKS